MASKKSLHCTRLFVYLIYGDALSKRSTCSQEDKETTKTENVVSCSHDLGMVEFCRDWLKYYFIEVETLGIGHHPTRGDSGILGQVIHQCIMYK